MANQAAQVSFVGAVQSVIVTQRGQANSAPKRKLWEEAVEQLKRRETLMLSDLLDNPSFKSPELVQGAVQKKLDECIRRQWTYTNKDGKKVALRAVLERISSWVSKFKEIGDQMVQYDPGHAAIPWAIVRFFLQATVNDVETFGGMAEGLEMTAGIIVRGAEMERDALFGKSTLKDELARRLVKMYSAVLLYLAKAGAYFSQNTAQRMFKSVFKTPERAVHNHVRKVEKLDNEVGKVAELVRAESQNAILDSIQGTADSVANAISSKEKRERIQEFLGRPVDYTVDVYQNNIKNRHEQTCEWILPCQVFLDWTSKDFAHGKSKILWLHGGPGFGKTLLCAHIIEHLQSLRDSVAYFFCMSEHEHRRDPIMILRSWIAQAIDDNDCLVELVCSSTTFDRRRPATAKELWSIFESIVSQTQVTFVVDGFDECISDSTYSRATRYDNDDARLEFLRALVNGISKSTCEVLIVSRDVDDIRSQFEHLNGETSPAFLEYKITAKDTSNDVASFSKSMVDRRLHNKPEHLRQDIAEQAVMKAGGMFLWVSLLESKLDRGENARMLRKTVAEMPKGIDKAYERDLKRIEELDGSHRNRALAILRWVLFAFRPLTVCEMTEAIALSADEAGTTYSIDELPDNWQEGFVDKENVDSIIRRPCGSLIDIRCNGDHDPLPLHTVHFVHYSVKEYLLKWISWRQPGKEIFAIGFGNIDIVEEHIRLAKLCLQYLCYDVFENLAPTWYKNEMFDYPFLDYAARFWHDHAKHKKPLDTEVEDFVQKLLNPNTSNWKLWATLFEEKGHWFNVKLDQKLQQKSENLNRSGWSKVLGYNHDIETEKRTANPVYDTAKLGEDYDDEIEKRIANPMYYAAVLNTSRVIKALNQSGLDCNVLGGKYGFPLQAAVANGSRAAVKTLIELGADVSQIGGSYHSALFAAVKLGLEEELELLISHGADLASTDNIGFNALHFACRSGQQSVSMANLIIANSKQNVMMKSLNGYFPLSDAVTSGNVELVRTLLAAGAEPNKSNISLLQRSIQWGFFQISQELIQYQADCSATVYGGRTYLHTAAVMGDVETIQMLLAQKLPINSQDDEGDCPVGLAVRSRNPEAIKFLVGQGADVNVKNKKGDTALHTATEFGKRTASKLLIDAGADVNAKGRHGVTALHLAAMRGDQIILKLLIDAGADVNAIDDLSRTPVACTILRRRVDCFQVLLDSGAQWILGADWLLRFPGVENFQVLIEKGAIFDLAVRGSKTNADEIRNQAQERTIKILNLLLSSKETDAVELLKNEPHGDPNLTAVLFVAIAFKCLAAAELAIDRGAPWSIPFLGNRTLLHIVVEKSMLPLNPLVRRLLESSPTVAPIDSLGFTPTSLSIEQGYTNLDRVKYLIDRGGLMSEDDREAKLTTDEIQILEGKWEGFYELVSWCAGQKADTEVEIAFNKRVPDATPFTFEYQGSDEAGQFIIYGQALNGSRLRWGKMYDHYGFIYNGACCEEEMPDGQKRLKLRGTWGKNLHMFAAAFEFTKGSKFEHECKQQKRNHDSASGSPGR